MLRISVLKPLGLNKPPQELLDFPFFTPLASHHELYVDDKVLDVAAENLTELLLALDILQHPKDDLASQLDAALDETFASLLFMALERCWFVFRSWSLPPSSP